MIRRTLNPGRYGRYPLVRRYRGFSLVEVMMSVVLMGIGMALALPSYRDMVEKRQVTNGAEQLAAFINTAQGIAQRKNLKVTVSWTPTDDEQWCIGMAEDEVVCDCQDAPAACLVDDQQYVIHNSIAGDKTRLHSLASESHAFYIDPLRGLSLPCGGENPDSCPDTELADLAAMEPPVDIELRSPSGDFRLKLQVNNAGRITLCSLEGHEIPGYAVCLGGNEANEVAGL